MIAIKLTALILSINLIETVSAASISNVFVESRTSPTRYYPNSSPYGYTSVASPYYNQIKTLSGSVPVYTDPCVSPCVPGQTLTAIRPSTRVVTYNSPYTSSLTVPVIVGSTNEDQNGYQYSYVVYDDNTGDHKAQSELSDGSVVQGEYAFIQPDGYVRKIQYVADDLKGFNAVVKNYGPITLDNTRQFEIKHNEHGQSCNDEKKATLKEPLTKELNDLSEKHTLDFENNAPDHKFERLTSDDYKNSQDYDLRTSENNRKGEIEQNQAHIKESKKIFDNTK